MIWAMFMDYTKWTGDTSFVDEVGGALASLSFGGQQYVLFLFLALYFRGAVLMGLLDGLEGIY